MKCTRIDFADGMRAVVCGSTGGGRIKIPRCSVEECGLMGTRLCDWKIGGGKTCSAPVCIEHTHQPAPDKDLCPTHAAEWAEIQRQQALPL